MLDDLESKIGAEEFSQTFKTITVDNGSEFLDSAALEKSIERINETRTNIYYCRSYASYERGSNGQIHTLIRRFIPKGSAISKYSKQQVSEIRDWINNYPRRILDSLTAVQAIKEEISPVVQQLFLKCA